MKIVDVRLFFYQSIGIEENNTFQLKLFTYVGVKVGVANFFLINR